MLDEAMRSRKPSGYGNSNAFEWLTPLENLTVILMFKYHTAAYTPPTINRGKA